MKHRLQRVKFRSNGIVGWKPNAHVHQRRMSCSKAAEYTVNWLRTIKKKNHRKNDARHTSSALQKVLYSWKHRPENKNSTQSKKRSNNTISIKEKSGANGKWRQEKRERERVRERNRPHGSLPSAYVWVLCNWICQYVANHVERRARNNRNSNQTIEKINEKNTTVFMAKKEKTIF